jgi:4-amino-4-deoxy-L-arabinose transferase-like glycosyltransferase
VCLSGDCHDSIWTVAVVGDHEGATEVVNRRPSAPLDRRIFVVAGALFVLLMALSGLYGFDRDELYFLDCARHLQASYVDQPVFAPLLARISLWLFGVSLPGLRLWPSLAGASTVVFGALLAREFGGGSRAQIFAAVGVATAPAVLGADHIFGPTAFDLLAWSALAFFVARIDRTGDLRLWIPAGVVLGLGLANKHSIGFFALALAIGALASGGRRLLFNRWSAAGLVLALMFTIPDLWWQSGHGWATITMTRALAKENGGLGNALSFIPSQIFMATPFLVWMWIAGLRLLWRSANPLRRSFAWSYGLLFVFFAATSGAKPYYIAGTYVVLLASGAVRAEQQLAAGGLRLRRFVMSLGVSLLCTVPFVLPVLPPEDIGWVHSLNTTPAETVGWPELVHTVATVWRTLPPAERTKSVIFTLDYGEAGAINELGRQDDLPEAVSGHNTDWWWGPGNPDATTVVAVMPGPMDGTDFGKYLGRFFRHVEVAATITNHAHLANQEAGGHVYICTGPVREWGRLWPQLRLYA